MLPSPKVDTKYVLSQSMLRISALTQHNPVPNALLGYYMNSERQNVVFFIEKLREQNHL